MPNPPARIRQLPDGRGGATRVTVDEAIVRVQELKRDIDSGRVANTRLTQREDRLWFDALATISLGGLSEHDAGQLAGVVLQTRHYAFQRSWDRIA